MIAEKQIAEFLSRMRQAAGENLQSVILYGSGADGEFHPNYSNVNLLCVLRETSFAALNDLAPAVHWWTRKKYHVPLLLTRDELKRSADVFSIELLDMREQHRVLYGEDVFEGLTIPMRFHRVQLEYELREKTILLRERMLLARLIQLDPSAFLQLLDIREKKVDHKRLDVNDVAGRYLTAVQQITAAVDT